MMISQGGNTETRQVVLTPGKNITNPHTHTFFSPSLLWLFLAIPAVGPGLI